MVCLNRHLTSFRNLGLLAVCYGLLSFRLQAVLRVFRLWTCPGRRWEIIYQTATFYKLTVIQHISNLLSMQHCSIIIRDHRWHSNLKVMNFRLIWIFLVLAFNVNYVVPCAKHWALHLLGRGCLIFGARCIVSKALFGTKSAKDSKCRLPPGRGSFRSSQETWRNFSDSLNVKSPIRGLYVLLFAILNTLQFAYQKSPQEFQVNFGIS
jgi:hypothetical protein